MLGIVVSRADVASAHVGERLLAATDWTVETDAGRPDAAGGGTVHRTTGVELRTFDDLHIELERPDAAFDGADLLVFASRHSGETGPLLTAHHTGNFSAADFGGEPNQLAEAAPGALAAAVAALDEHAPVGFDVGIECTHHGPTAVDVPSLFVEVGSDEAQWQDRVAADAAARAILALRDAQPMVERAFVGFGGGHYAPRFARIVRETDWAVGHVAADWALDGPEGVSPEVVDQAFERSGARLGVIDGERPDLAARIDDLGYRVVGESWLRETTGVPLDLVERAESRLSSVDAGLRFGDDARGQAPGGELEVVDPPGDLLATVNGIDAERVRKAVAAETVAYETTEAGSRVEGRLAFADAAAHGRLETALVDLLRERYESVAVEDAEIVVRERAFDAERARELGVEAGPAFGELAAGRPVTVDGTPVEPDDVHVIRTRRYPRVGAENVRRKSDDGGNSNEDRSETGRRNGLDRRRRD